MLRRMIIALANLVGKVREEFREDMEDFKEKIRDHFYGHSREEILARLEAVNQEKFGGKLNWEQSVVDRMKLLDLDSSLAGRAKLATDLGHKGAEFTGTAEQNIWLNEALLKGMEDYRIPLPKTED